MTAFGCRSLPGTKMRLMVVNHQRLQPALGTLNRDVCFRCQQPRTPRSLFGVIVCKIRLEPGSPVGAPATELPGAQQGLSRSSRELSCRTAVPAVFLTWR